MQILDNARQISSRGGSTYKNLFIPGGMMDSDSHAVETDVPPAPRDSIV